MKKFWFTFRNEFAGGQVAVDAENEDQAYVRLHDVLGALMTKYSPQPLAFVSDVQTFNRDSNESPNIKPMPITHCLRCMRKAEPGSNYCAVHSPTNQVRELIDRDRDDRPPQPWRRNG